MSTPYDTTQGYQQDGVPAGPSAEDRSMATLAHLSTIAAMVLSVGSLSFVGPLAVWFIYKDRSRFVREAAAGAFNFNISMWALFIIGAVLTITFVGAIVGLPMMFCAVLAQLICHIIGAVKANKGEHFDYPMTFIRVLS